MGAGALEGILYVGSVRFKSEGIGGIWCWWGVGILLLFEGLNLIDFEPETE